jgi:hypothetical protein
MCSQAPQQTGWAATRQCVHASAASLQSCPAAEPLADQEWPSSKLRQQHPLPVCQGMRHVCCLPDSFACAAGAVPVSSHAEQAPLLGYPSGGTGGSPVQQHSTAVAALSSLTIRQ